MLCEADSIVKMLLPTYAAQHKGPSEPSLGAASASSTPLLILLGSFFSYGRIALYEFLGVDFPP